jgi:ribosomal protein L22
MLSRMLKAKRLNFDNVFVRDTQVYQAQKGRRRTYREHGRINGKQLIFFLKFKYKI